MDILRNMIGFLLSVSLGALGAVMGGALLVAIRVAASPRRRRQFHRLMSADASFVIAIRRLLNEAPDVADDTASRVSVRVS